MVLGLLAVLIVHVSNLVRHQHYWSELVTPGLRYMADNQALLNSVTVSSLSVAASHQENIEPLTRTRLKLGQVVFTDDDGLYRSYVSLNEELLLELESDQSGRGIYELYVWIVYQLLADSLVDKQMLADKLSAWQVEMQRVESVDFLQSQAALDSLAEVGHYLLVSKQSVSALLKSPEGQVYRLDFKAPYSSFSWPVVALLLLGALASIYGMVVLFVQIYERKLRSLETVAARIARGELDARVKDSDQSNEAMARLSRAFNAMAEHIQRLMFVQKEMIHAVSHELRTPVARIRFGVQMIEDCPNEDALQKQLTGIDSDIQELDELIDEILTYARLEQGGPILSFHDANLFEIVDQVVSEQRVGKPDMDISAQLESNDDAWRQTEVEERYIHRSIQNLVGNATRYAKGRVKVSCVCDADTCRVDVEDDGPGILEDQWESVFTPFARLDDSRTRSSGGYGLGLSIVRRILYWHGGQAFLGRSETLGGAKFSLVWPRLQRDAEALSEQRQA